MDFLNGLFSFITDKANKVSHKAFTMITILFIMYMVDNLIGFSYYSNIKNKIEVVDMINKTLKDSSLLSADKIYLADIRSSTMKRASLKDKAWVFLTDFSINEPRTTSSAVNKVSINPTSIYKVLSGSWFFILIFLLAPFQKSGTDTWDRVIMDRILVMAFIVIGGFISYKLLWLLPIIAGNILYNYILNALVNLVILFVAIVAED